MYVADSEHRKHKRDSALLLFTCTRNIPDTTTTNSALYFIQQTKADRAFYYNITTKILRRPRSILRTTLPKSAQRDTVTLTCHYFYTVANNCNIANIIAAMPEGASKLTRRVAHAVQKPADAPPGHVEPKTRARDGNKYIRRARLRTSV